MMTGQIITDLRTKANLTQEQLAEKLFVSRELVSKWETDKSLPNHQAVLQLSEIFSAEPEEILNRNEAMLNELSICIPEHYLTKPDDLTVLLNKFLENLGERERNIFIRRYYCTDEIYQIANIYGIKSGYVRTVLMRTKKKLGKFLKEQ